MSDSDKLSGDEFQFSGESATESHDSSEELRPITRVHKSVSYSEAFDEEEDFSESQSKEGAKIEKIFSHRKLNDFTEFFVKYKNQSYRKCCWVPEGSVIQTRSGKNLLVRYRKHFADNPPVEPFFPEEYCIPDRVIGHEIMEGTTFYVVKWKGLQYEDITLEIEEPFLLNLINEYLKNNANPPIKDIIIPPRPLPSSWKRISVLPTSKSGKVMRLYQLEGLNFFANHWYNRKNVILADEMGLGKTCQGSVFLNYLHKEQKIQGPFLILAPLTTIPHWERELDDWTELKVISFYGSKSKRESIKKYELFYEDSYIPKFNVLLTTYEYAMKDAMLFEMKFTWQCLIIDEAHRLKNFESKLTQTMHSYKADFKILLTGTPLQNNTQELWSILNFIDERSFQSLQEFHDKFGTLSDTDQIVQLQAILHPIMLRRLKGDVEKNIAPLEEIIIECGMSSHQRAYYKSIFSKNIEYLTRGAHQSNSANLQNIFMELRKVCNHPYLVKGAEDQILVERRAMQNIPEILPIKSEFVNDSLIRTSGKMILLDKLLSKLKKDGHRVLIFSQMTRMLDIIQDYLSYRNYQFERIDGSVKSELRQAAIDRYNEAESEDFVFLLCTKAGGLGINLTSADTVIIYDSDWNPQNDIQATARCHRIGQTKNVKVYRFLTAKSYEKKMFDTAAIKLGLDHAVLEAPKFQHKVDEMEKLLRLGAYYAFEDEDESNERFNEDDIDDIISRSKTIKHENVFAGDGSTFSKAEFYIDGEDNIDVSAPDFWKKYMPEVKEDEIYTGISIAERKRIMRESNAEKGKQILTDEELNAMDVTSGKIIIRDDEYIWTRKKIIQLQQQFLKFGWGRWHAIFDGFDRNCDIAIMKAVCHVFVKCYINGLEESNSDIEHIYSKGTTPDTIRFENNFMKTYREELMQNVSTCIAQKTNRLSILYYLNIMISTCNNPPDGLDFPKISSQKPADWWTVEDDKALLYGVWKHGSQQYNEIKFSNEEPLVTKLLNQRIKSLVKSYKNTVLKKEIGTDIHSTSHIKKDTRSPWSKKESRQVQSTLCNFGYPSFERFIEKAQVTSKDAPTLERYVKEMIEYCQNYEENHEPDVGILIEHLTIGQAQRVTKRVKLFERAREELANTDRSYSEKDKRLLQLFDENGYIDLENQAELIEILGSDCLEGKLTKKISQLIKPEISKGEIITLHSFATPEYERDENGKPIFPINVSPALTLNNLGTIIYDRPGFHNERYLYPDGFETEKLYTSCLQIGERIWYKSSIHDEGGDVPVFRVSVPGTDIVFEGAAPSNPWLMVIKAIEDRKKQEGLPANRSLTISGPEAFGLSNPFILNLMQEIPNIHKCKKYRRHKTEENEKDGKTDNVITTRSERNKHVEESKSNPLFASLRKPKRNIEQLTLTLDFSKLLEKTEKAENLHFISIINNDLIQETSLTIPIDPDSNNSIKTAIEAMADRVDN